MSLLTAHEFVTKWRGDARKERSVSQEHFINLCQLVGHETPGDNRDGTLVFEAGVVKDSGTPGWADAWKKGYFGWEYKGPKADLGKAYDQIKQYRESLLNPPLLVVSDIQTIIIHTNFSNTVKQTYTLTLADLETAVGLQTLRNVFYNPDVLRPATTVQQVTEVAATEFAQLADLLRRYGSPPAQIAHFLIRLLFCLFAEDIGLLPPSVFSKIIQATRHRAPAFAAQVKALFGTMATGGFFGSDDIKHFNGGLFDDDTALQLDSDGLAILERVSKLDWANIEPSIFGTLFERSLDPSKRAQLGAHYTGREDIMLIVEPVLMAPLHRRWREVQAAARSLAAKRDAASGATRNRHQSGLSRLLMDFAGEIAAVRVLDPACGSGNFLYVALKQLLDLEKQVINFGADLGLSRMFPTVGPEQLHGIEVNEYAHELAQVTVWIGYIQWLRDNGFGEPSQPILQPLDTIVRQDAILAYNDQGEPVEPPWPEADVIIGNPPFLGGNKIRQGLGDTYVNELFALYEGRVPAFADLVCYWFERGRALIEADQVKRVGLLTTQGIRGGANRKVLERIKETGDIFMAWSDRKWILNGAAVRVSMVGFDNGSEVERTFDGAAATTINADLTVAVDLTQARVLRENQGVCFMGPSPKAPFDIEGVTAAQMLVATNPGGTPNSDVVRPVASAVDLVQRNRRKWTIDFGLMPEQQAKDYEKPYDYVKTHVYPVRIAGNRAKYTGNWWQYARPRHEMRSALSGKHRFIATPAVSKYRIFVWMKPDVLCNQGTLVFAHEDDFFFGVLQSIPHELWARGTGTQLREAESGFRYTPTSTFETFPFPWPPGQEPQGDQLVEAITDAARNLVQLRDDWLNDSSVPEADQKKRTLTNLYNARPQWLADAHQGLDVAVFAAYGWPADLSDQEILARLLELNQARAATRGAAPPPPPDDQADETEG